MVTISLSDKNIIKSCYIELQMSLDMPLTANKRNNFQHSIYSYMFKNLVYV